MTIKDAFKVSALPVLFASLCCLSPVILVLLGLSSVSFATSLADKLYGHYKWVFRLLGLIMLTAAIIYYLRQKKGICTIDDALRRRNELINIVAISVIAGVLGYVVFLYVVVEYAGIFLKIWA